MNSPFGNHLHFELPDYLRKATSTALNENISEYLSSLSEDIRIAQIDIDVVEAHVLMLHKAGYLSQSQLIKIIRALEQTRDKWQLYVDKNFTDIHPAIEAAVVDKCGIDIGGQLNLARSRNDQVAADTKLYIRKELIEVYEKLLLVEESLLSAAKEYENIVMPAFTHSLPAQPTTYGYYLLSFVEQFLRTLERLQNCFGRINRSPMGSCAVAGTTLNIDREYVAKLLGFEKVIDNTIDATSSRDSEAEFGYLLCEICIILGRLASDILLFSGCGMVRLCDDVVDTSSVMPQKRNPCVVELLRARASRAIATIVELLTILKGLPSGYNRDLQQFKLSLWQLVDLAKSSIDIATKLISSVKPQPAIMHKILYSGHSYGVVVSEYLVKKCKVAFRQAYAIVAEALKKTNDILNYSSLQESAKTIIGCYLEINDNELNYLLKNIPVQHIQLSDYKARLDNCKSWLDNCKTTLQHAHNNFRNIINQLLSFGKIEDGLT